MSKRSDVCRVPLFLCAPARELLLPADCAGGAGRGCGARRGLGCSRREVAVRCRAVSCGVQPGALAPLAGGGGLGAAREWPRSLKRGGSSEAAGAWPGAARGRCCVMGTSGFQPQLLLVDCSGFSVALFFYYS